MKFNTQQKKSFDITMKYVKEKFVKILNQYAVPAEEIEQEYARMRTEVYQSIVERE